MSLEKWKIACTRESICFLDLTKSLRSLINRKLFRLCSCLLFLRSYPICTFHSTMVNRINVNMNRTRKNDSCWKICLGMETVPRHTLQKYKLVFQVGIEDSIRSITLGPIPNILRHKCDTILYTFLKFIQATHTFVHYLLQFLSTDLLMLRWSLVPWLFFWHPFCS